MSAGVKEARARRDPRASVWRVVGYECGIATACAFLLVAVVTADRFGILPIGQGIVDVFSRIVVLIGFVLVARRVLLASPGGARKETPADGFGEPLAKRSARLMFSCARLSTAVATLLLCILAALVTAHFMVGRVGRITQQEFTVGTAPPVSLGGPPPDVGSQAGLGLKPHESLETTVLAVAIAGHGSVTSVPGGIACGADCSESYAIGTVVTLSATPAADSIFAGWSGACSGTGRCTVRLDAVKTVTATFTPPTFALGPRGPAGHAGPARPGLGGVVVSVEPVPTELPPPQAGPATSSGSSETPGPTPLREATPAPSPTARRPRGSLLVLSEPAGAQVTLNGVPVGEAPVLLDSVECGTYTVTVALANHEPLSRSTEVCEGLTRVAISLAPQKPLITASVSLSTSGLGVVGGLQGLYTLGLATAQYAIEIDAALVVDWQIGSIDRELLVAPGAHRIRVLLKPLVSRDAIVLYDANITLLPERPNSIHIDFLLSRVTVNGTSTPFADGSLPRERGHIQPPNPRHRQSDEAQTP